ncbi:tyrosine-type recombinase/integrase [Chitinophaga rhizophila]|uniref:Tyrosine-type recombinase/integrase n=1 Tax=Chitinophaga rhizophila TaxID=2866212 RepID=A0ABS7GL05_9BACT|nr:tyrosine-type recombinase/integrase [Chitinophaga rhizophila]MBW8688399.1 tyrosine-type recombinase/integrase [Chitinophaga rhizophila]
MEDYITRFKSYLHQSGYSVGTQRMLPGCVRDFLAYAGCKAVIKVTPQIIGLFYEWLHVRPLKRKGGALSGMMIRHYVYALKVFFSWLEESGELLYNPMSGLRLGKVERGNREALSVAVVKELFSGARSVRERVMLHLFYSCGLRRSEAEQLNVRDVQVRHRLLYVRSGKGASRRVIPLTGKVAAELGVYLEQYRKASGVEQRAFMLNRVGKRMSGESYSRLLKALVKRESAWTGISPHYLRHSIATHLLQGGMPLEYVRDFLGHRHLEATQLYAKVAPGQLALL